VEEARQHSAVKLVRELTLTMLAAGMLGWLGCFYLAASADSRLDAHPEYSRPGPDRTTLIHTKYHDGYVEQEYADRIANSERLQLVFYGLMLVGGLGWAAYKKQESRQR
jgi:hypothetical protein